MNLLRRVLFGKDPSLSSASEWDLDRPLLNWGKGDAWSIRDAVAGTMITGSTGSGKTSGSGRTIALSMLRAGFGGLVLSVKPDEREVWSNYCSEAGREDDLFFFGPEESLRFNFLEYEHLQAGSDSGLTENIVALFSTVLEAAERDTSGGGGRDEEGFWRRAQRQLIRNCVDLLSLGSGNVTIPDIHRVVLSAPTSRDQARSPEWRERSRCFQLLQAADSRSTSARQQADLALVADFFLVEFASLAEKTRSVIVSSFSSLVDVLNRGVLRELFCSSSNVTSDVIADGKILFLDLPVKRYAEIGVIAQVLWKYAFQRAIERRESGSDARPVFLWADEAQFFLTSNDALFQTTCRSSKVATVLLTQCVSNVYAALGGEEKGRAEATSLFANCTTKIFHSCIDPTTNEWAASQVGRSRQMMASGNMSQSADERMNVCMGLGGLGASGSTSSGFSEVMEFEIPPQTFTELRTGGPTNDFCVDGIVLQSGRRFQHSGRHWMRTSFSQRG